MWMEVQGELLLCMEDSRLKLKLGKLSWQKTDTSGCLPLTKTFLGATEHLKGSPVFLDGVFQTKTVNQLVCPCKW